MDQGAPQWVFLISMIFMIDTALAALVGDRRVAAKRRARAGRRPRPPQTERRSGRRVWGGGRRLQGE